MSVHRDAVAKLPRRTGSRSGPVRAERVDPRVWQTALRLADGDRSRIRVISPRKVEVINAPR
jgi:hypothetical protein